MFNVSLFFIGVLVGIGVSCLTFALTLMTGPDDDETKIDPYEPDTKERK